ncbi:dephospho-CoA kinase [Lacisediminihabitans changchengi]|uniref:Dephospho-CoA kinase n=1 Tax=Lacisediminihabitans changchengi TaxID=2787634 RepID=A0A934W3U3_9MICO|nr:dephospho-CoA kinase [Lacisediminihabitans changchengi]MBK4346830.1 dephospho-CoA kinase [Lacisediminihabitans changchengi]MBK4348047.1 dephospho-CoA kinase [Lacisediminihabitans changchengi]
MHLIGLTGGIASGKSAVAQRLASHGAIVIDADRLAREVVEPGTPGLAAVADRFGAGVITADGMLDRPALGAIIFTDDRARLDLNAITHPLVQQRARDLIAAAEAHDPDAVVVYDVPLLLEASSQSGYHRFEKIIVVEAEPATRIRRLVELRGMSDHDAARRIASQATDAERRAIADIVIDSNGTLDDTLAQADDVWTQLREL